MDDLKLTPTSHVTAEAGDLVLRETKTTRLLFRPLMVSNPKDEDAAVKGELVYQRKSRKDAWEDHNTLKLSELKADEWVKVGLKSGEVLKLVTYVRDLYEVYSERGIPQRPTKYVEVGSHAAALLDASDEEFSRFFRVNEEEGIAVFHRLLSWISEFANPKAVVERLEQLDPPRLSLLSAAVGLGALKQAVSLWQENRDNANEGFWQDTFLSNQFILSQVFRFPIVLIQDKAYVGGKVIDNTGGQLVDYLVSNKMTHNAALIELKTPVTPLLGEEYRAGVYSPSSKLSGAVAQVQSYKMNFLTDAPGLPEDSRQELAPFYPRAVVIVGDIEEQLSEESEVRSFEIYRNGLRDVDVITYDELFERVNSVISVLEEGLNRDQVDSMV